MINVVKQAISKDTCEVLSQSMELMRVMMGNPPDPTINNAFGYYSPVFLESLMLHMQPKIEKKVSKKLYPTYSYGRIYGQGSVLEKHTDRPSGEYGVTCCLEKHCK